MPGASIAALFDVAMATRRVKTGPHFIGDDL